MVEDREKVKDAIDDVVLSFVKEAIRSIDTIGRDSTDIEEFKRSFRYSYFQTYIRAVNEVSRSISGRLNCPTITYDFDTVVDIMFKVYSAEKKRVPKGQTSPVLQGRNYDLDLKPARK
jgi:hypothetical protein